MAAGDLTTIDRVRAHLAIEGVDADPLLEAQITASSAWFLAEIDRSILSGAYTEHRIGSGCKIVTLRNYPVTSITSVAVDGVTIAAVSDLETDGYYLHDGTNERPAGTIELAGSYRSGSIRIVSVSYVGGFATVPADVELAVRLHTVFHYLNRTRDGFATTAGGGESASFQAAPISFAYIRDVIDRYRQAVIA